MYIAVLPEPCRDALQDENRQFAYDTVLRFTAFQRKSAERFIVGGRSVMTLRNGSRAVISFF